jgi:hypothetical protein
VYTRVILYVYYGILFSHGPTEQIYGERFLPLSSAAQWLDRKVGDKRWVLATSEIGLMGYECRLPILDLFGLASPQIHPFLADRRELRMVLRFRPELYVTCNADEFDPRHPRYNQALAREFERSYRLFRQMSPGAEGLRIYLRRDLLWPR